MAESGALTPAQRRAIAAMLESRDVRSAAKVANIAERTLTRWLTLPNFKAALREAEGGALSAAIRRLTNATGAAVDVLEDAMGATTGEDAAPTHGTRIRAADIVLSRLLSLRELHDVEARIAALETAQGTKE